MLFDQNVLIIQFLDDELMGVCIELHDDGFDRRIALHQNA